MAITRTFVALVVAAAVAVIASAGLRAQAGAAAVPFKLGTFEQGGRTFVGLVLRDAQIVDIARANTAYEAANASAQKLTAPADMKQLITRYDGEWRARLMAIARTDNIRDVVAFPKTQTHQDLMLGAPSPVDPAQLEELHIQVVPPKKPAS